LAKRLRIGNLLKNQHFLICTQALTGALVSRINPANLFVNGSWRYRRHLALPDKVLMGGCWGSGYAHLTVMV
jgi:hypothetical protein